MPVTIKGIAIVIVDQGFAGIVAPIVQIIIIIIPRVIVVIPRGDLRGGQSVGIKKSIILLPWCGAIFPNVASQKGNMYNSV
jgi:hypothetical protein